MKAAIEVENRHEGDRIKTALSDPTTRAFVNIIGTLSGLSPAARVRVLRFVEETLAEEEQPSSGTGKDA